MPEGWQIEKVGASMELAYGKSLPKRNRIKGAFPVYGSGGIDGYHEASLVEGPGIVVGRKGTVGAIYWEDGDFFPIDTTFFVRPLRGEAWLLWIYQRLLLMDISNMGADSAVPGVNRNVVHDYRWVVPDDTMITVFNSVLTPWQGMIRSNKAENDTIAELRDTLLPKLLYGEIRLKQAEKVVEGVV